MFLNLLDHDNDDAADDAAAAAAAAPAAARQDHHAGPIAHSAAAKLRMKAARQKRLANHHQSVANALVNRHIDTFSEHIAAVSFGKKSPETRKLLSLGTVGSIALTTSKSGNRSNDYRIAKQYGCVSAARAQARGLNKYLAYEFHGTLRSSVSIGSFDDAAMWLKDPCSKADRDAGIRFEGMKLKDGSLWRRGANISLPVYNATEAVITRRSLPESSEEILRAAIIHSPSQVLPAANTATVANRWRRWHGAGIAGAGSRFDMESVSSPYSETAWHTIVSTSDNLAMNDCVTGLDESMLKSSLDAGLASYHDCVTLLTLHCAGHSAVLSTKESSTRLDGVPAKMVRMGHQFESGRTKAKFDQFIIDAITESFEFIPVETLPPESADWKAHALNVLRISRPCLDLTVDDELFIVSVDNSDWRQPGWKHFCVGPPVCVCRGNRDFALKLMIKCGRMSIGKVESTPLEYRWKGVERFAAKTFRARQQHDILLTVCLRIWPPSDTQRSQAAMERLAASAEAANSNLSNDAMRHKADLKIS